MNTATAEVSSNLQLQFKYLKEIKSKLRDESFGFFDCDFDSFTTGDERSDSHNVEQAEKCEKLQPHSTLADTLCIPGSSLRSIISDIEDPVF